MFFAPDSTPVWGRVGAIASAALIAFAFAIAARSVTSVLRRMWMNS